MNLGCLQGGRVACKEGVLPARRVGCLQGGWVACREGRLPAKRMHGCREDGWGCREGRCAGLIPPDVPTFLNSSHLLPLFASLSLPPPSQIDSPCLPPPPPPPPQIASLLSRLPPPPQIDSVPAIASPSTD